MAAGYKRGGKSGAAGAVFVVAVDVASMRAGVKHGLDSMLPAPRSILAEMVSAGVKHTPSNTVRAGRNGSRRIIFLELGDDGSGLAHIFYRHTDHFAGRGITVDHTPDSVIRAATEGQTVETAGTSGTVFEVMFDGSVQQVTVVVASNGYIVSAYPN